MSDSAKMAPAGGQRRRESRRMRKKSTEPWGAPARFFALKTAASSTRSAARTQGAGPPFPDGW